MPLGVIFMIYESRPNVTVDAAALCVKSGNAVILRGGKEAIHTNRALHRILADELIKCGLPEQAVQLVATIDRAAVGELLRLPEFIDLAIPRGGESLIRRVAAEAKMPVLKHYQGNCHVYVDARCDLDMAVKNHPQLQGSAPGRLQCGRDAAGSSRDRRRLSPQGGRGPDARGSRAARRPDRLQDRSRDERPPSPPTGIPSISTRSWPSRSSSRSTRRSTTSRFTARATPRRS